MVGDLETLILKYWTAVRRVRRMAVPATDQAIVFADVEVIYREARAAEDISSLPQLDLDAVFFQSK